jgi:hypothetical protein
VPVSTAVIAIGFAKLQMMGDLEFSDFIYEFGAGIFFLPSSYAAAIGEFQSKSRGGLYPGGSAVDGGAGLPSTVLGSINSVRVPSGSKRFACRLRLIPTCSTIGSP